MNISFISNQVWLIAALLEPSYLCHLYFVGCLIPNTISSLSHQYRCTLMASFKFLLLQLNLNHRYTMRSFMFGILQGDMTRSKVILTFTCLKMYIARSGDISGLRTTLFVATFGTLAPPIPKKIKNKLWAPLCLCPPPPPKKKVQNCAWRLLAYHSISV